MRVKKIEKAVLNIDLSHMTLSNVSIGIDILEDNIFDIMAKVYYDYTYKLAKCMKINNKRIIRLKSDKYEITTVENDIRKLKIKLLDLDIEDLFRLKINCSIEENKKSVEYLYKSKDSYELDIVKFIKSLNESEKIIDTDEEDTFINITNILYKLGDKRIVIEDNEYNKITLYKGDLIIDIKEKYFENKKESNIESSNYTGESLKRLIVDEMVLDFDINTVYKDIIDIYFEYKDRYKVELEPLKLNFYNKYKGREFWSIVIDNTIKIYFDINGKVCIEVDIKDTDNNWLSHIQMIDSKDNNVDLKSLFNLNVVLNGIKKENELIISYNNVGSIIINKVD